MEILSNRAKLSLYKKSSQSGYSTDILEQVYVRGYTEWFETDADGSPEQYAFNRVNSFISGGFASELDEDLKSNNPCWKGYEAIGTKKKNGKTVPNCVPTKESYTGAEKTSDNMEDPASRFIGTPNLTKVYADMTPNETSPTLKTIKRVVREQLEEDWQKVNRKDKTDGMSQKAVNAYRRENPGSKLKTAVTEKNPKGERADRRKNFCSRMSGMKKRLTSAETARDPDSRINKALRRWNCEDTQNEAVMAPPPVAQGPSVAERPAVRRAAPSGTQRLQGNSYYAGQNLKSRTGSVSGQQSPTWRAQANPPPRTFTPRSGAATGQQAPTWRATANAPRPSVNRSYSSSTRGSGGFGATQSASVKTAAPVNAEPSTVPSGGKTPVPTNTPTKMATPPKGADIIKSGTKGLNKILGKAGAVGAAAGLSYAASKEIASRYKEQHSGGLIPHASTPGVSAKDSFARMKDMKAPAANTAPAPAAPEAPKTKIDVGQPEKLGTYNGKVGDTTIKKGQTLSGIAKANKTTVGDIMNKNSILNANRVRAGSKIFTKEVPTPPKRTNEETVNELSAETMKDYTSAAEAQMKKIAKKDPMNTTSGDTDTFLKRKAGVTLAKEKLGQ